MEVAATAPEGLQSALKLVLDARLADRPAVEVLGDLKDSYGAMTWTKTSLWSSEPDYWYIRACDVGASTDIDEQALLAEWSINAVARLRKHGIRP